MGFITEFKKSFNIVENVEIKETFNYLELKYIGNELSLPSNEQLLCLENLIPIRDKLFIYLECDNNEIAKYYKGDNILDFLSKIKKSLEDEDDENYLLTVTINKTVDHNNVTIYDFQSFTKCLNNLKIKELLFNINNLMKNDGVVYFRVSEKIFANTISIFFLQENEQISENKCDRIKTFNKRNQVATYLNASEYQLIADDFIFINSCNNKDLNLIFSKLSIIYSLIGICDISVIHEDKIEFILNGYRRIESVIYYNESFSKKLEEYINIYNWIYNEGNNTNSCIDKVGIARNIISIAIKTNNLIDIDNSTLASIKSAHEIYLKENVKEYLEVKNKIAEFLNDMTQKTSEVANSLGKSFYNNIKVALTFYGTIVIMNILSDKRLDNIFTTDILILSIAFIAFSFIFMLFSKNESNKEIERFKKKYERIRESYTDVLNDKDIEKIFKKDKYYKEDLYFIGEKINDYENYWKTVLIVMSSIIIIIIAYKISIYLIIKYIASMFKIL